MVRSRQKNSYRTYIMLYLALCVFYYAAYAVDSSFLYVTNQIAQACYILICLHFVYVKTEQSYTYILTPIVPFIFMNGIQYGLAPFIFYYGSPLALQRANSFGVISDVDIYNCNQLNITGTLFVFLGIWIADCYKITNKFPVKPKEIEQAILKPLLFAILCISLPVKYFYIVPFNLGLKEDAQLGFVANIGSMTLVALMLCFYLYKRYSRKYLYLGLFFWFLETMVAIPAFGKLQVALPTVFSLIGLYLAKPSKKILLSIALSIFVIFVTFEPLSTAGRNAGLNQKPQERFLLIQDYVTGNLHGNKQKHEKLTGGELFWLRNTFVNVQALLINLRNSNFSGNTITHEIFYIFIPRMIWSDKPIMARHGQDLGYLASNHTGTAVAPTAYAEAYWNGGWGLLIVIAIVIGFIFYSYSEYTRIYLENQDYRFLPIAFLGMRYGMSPESWVVSHFFGGGVSIASIWLVIKFLTARL